jgi:hypothetical protein
MANTDIGTTEIVTPAANNEVGRGYNRQIVLTSADLVANDPGSSDGDTQTYELFSLPVGSYLRGVYYYLRTAFDDSGGGASLTIQLGDTADADGILLAKQIHLDGTEVYAAIPDGAFFTVDGDVSTKNEVVYTTANVVEVLFTPTGYQLAELTAGEIVFVADIVYANQVQV